MLVKRQTNNSNLKRSQSYAKTASYAKLSGHKTEDIFAEAIGGNVVGGTVKADVVAPHYGNISVKKGKKLQLALYTSERIAKDLGSQHPYTQFAKATYNYYHDRHTNSSKNSKSLNLIAEQKAKDLASWLNRNNNFISLLDYVLTNNGEVDYVADLWETNNKFYYLTKRKDILNIIKSAKPIAQVTASGLRVSVGIDTSQGFRKTFSIEVRSDIKHYKSMLFKAESKWFLNHIRQSTQCIKESI